MNAVESDEILTPAQLFAARSLLRWSRRQLALRLSVSFKSIQIFEVDGKTIENFDLRKIRQDFEAAGVEFVDEKEGRAGVRLKKADGPVSISDEAAIPEMPEDAADDYDGSPM